MIRIIQNITIILLKATESLELYFAHIFVLRYQAQIVESAQNGASSVLRDRLMQEDADLTTEERAKIRAKLEEIANSGQW